MGTGSKQTKNQSAHKKPNSLANSKIADIINGLQHSLGVINQNMQGAQPTEEQEAIINKIFKEQTPEQQQLLIESALLAEKLAKMTNSLKANVQKQNSSSLEARKAHATIAYAQSNQLGSIPRQMRTLDKAGGVSKEGSSAKPLRKSSISGFQISSKGKSKQNQQNEDRLSIASADKKPPIAQAIQGQVQVQHQAPKVSGYHHQRNKSDVNQLKQDQKIQLVAQTIDNGQGQGGAIAPVAHSTKHISQPQTKNAFLSSQGQTRMPSKIEPKEPKATKTFDYDKRKDRFSDHHLPQNHKKKSMNPNASSSCNGTKILIEAAQTKQSQHLLKSAASSPSLAKNAHIENQQKKETVLKRKKSPRQSSASLSKHKRSASDGTSLQKMFHFKQQMMIQKFHQQKQKESNESQNSQEQMGKKNILISSQINPAINMLKSNPQNIALSQKRVSQEQMSTEKLSAFISSRQNAATGGLQAQKQQKAKTYSAKHTSAKAQKLTSGKQTVPKQNLNPNIPEDKRDIYQEMKSFISKFSIQAQPQPQGPQIHHQTMALKNQQHQKAQSSNVTCVKNSLNMGQTSQHSIKLGDTNNQKMNQILSNSSSTAYNVIGNQQNRAQVAQSLNCSAAAGQGLVSGNNLIESAVSYQPQKLLRTPNGSYHQEDPSKLAQSQNVQTQKKNFTIIKEPGNSRTNEAKILMPNAKSQGAKASHKRSKSDANQLIAQIPAQNPVQQHPKGFKFSEQQLQQSNKLPSQNSSSQKPQPFAFELANYNAQKAQEQDSKVLMQKQTTNAINLALSKQQMNSARQSPLNYIDLSNPSNLKAYLPEGLTSKDLMIDVGDDDNLVYGTAMANSPILKVLPTPKAQQPGCDLVLSPSGSQEEILQNYQRQEKQQQPVFSLPHQQHSRLEQKQLKLPIAEQNTPLLHQTQSSPLETCLDTLPDMSPKHKAKNRLRKQIKFSFAKYGEPLKTSSDFYRVGKLLGKGAFGKVNLAMHRLCEQLVAVKSVNKQYLEDDQGNKKKLMQELLILQQVKHKNIVQLYDSFETSKHVAFVIEVCAGGDILNYVRKRRKLTEQVCKQIFKQVLEGLHYCHKNQIVHRDIKLDNLLLDSEGNVKICDFGVSKQLKEGEIMNEQCGTPAYIAPEIIKGKGYTGFAVDCWSLGVCLYAMLFGTVPFKANNMSELHAQILKAKYNLKEDKFTLSDEVKHLLRMLLEPDPLKRLTIKQIRKHPWMKEVYQESFEPVELFTEQEKEKISKDFSYNDVARYERNQNNFISLQQQNEAGEQQQTENLFTEHGLDSTQNSMLKNNSTKSVILAPFNTTRTHLDPEDLPLEKEEGDDSVIYPELSFDRLMLYPKKVIKFAAKVKDIDRQYELNNNGEVDNGVYNKFVKQDSSDGSLASQSQDLQCGAPMGTQNSDEEAELAVQKQRQQSDCLLTQLVREQNFTTTLNTEQDDSTEEHNFDQEVLKKLEKLGYPQDFTKESLKNKELTDACTVYYLVLGMKEQAERAEMELRKKKEQEMKGYQRNNTVVLGSTKTS